MFVIHHAIEAERIRILCEEASKKREARLIESACRDAGYEIASEREI